MYIEYITPQRGLNSNFTHYKWAGDNFRPTWLIRISDWQRVSGTEAVDGYHALSYVWEQSGEMFKKDDGEYGLLDNGKHKITKPTANKGARTSSSKHQRLPDVSVTHEVTYNELLQQICKDFEIEYLWYDKICIDQTNKAEKQREIKQMHRIYSNARYTVAFVPEIYIDDPKKFDRFNHNTNSAEAKDEALFVIRRSLWWKRSWTLEELMMSTHLLVLGKNTHMWCLAHEKQGSVCTETGFLSSAMLGFKDKQVRRANEVLRNAHFRTSTKQHDKVFALANIFTGVVTIDINYKSDVFVMMSTFYRRLAQQDLSIMCFGSCLVPHGTPRYPTSMSQHGLPSWTGVAGLHTSHPITDITLDRDGYYNIDDRMSLHIKCKSHTIHPIKCDDYGVLSDPYRLAKARPEHYDIRRLFTSLDDLRKDEASAVDWGISCMSGDTGCLATHYWKPTGTIFSSPVLTLSLTEECDECIILSVLFKSALRKLQFSKDNRYTHRHVGYGYDYLAPVVKKCSDTPETTYKAIGIILVERFSNHESIPDSQHFLEKIFNSISTNTEEFTIV